MNQRELFLRHVAQTSDLPLLGVDVDVERAEGCWLYTRGGKKYLDLISGISVSSIGHCHPRVVKAVQQQTEKFMHLMVYGEFNQSPQVRYAMSLCKHLPEKLQSVYFTTGGSEAVEGAMKLAKRFTGRAEIISFKNAYHGSTQGALSLMGDEYFRQAYRPLLPATRQIRFNEMEDLNTITTDTAAVFIEPVQGEAGVRSASTSYLQALRKKCDSTGTLLVFDEIQTGFGRTGSLFSFQQHQVIPDVLLIAKGMGGGLPIGAFVSSNKIMAALTHDPVLGHINTFGGNAVCVEAARACLDVITEEQLSDKATKIESIVREQLKHPLIKEVRMSGALGAVDFGDEALNMRVIKACLDVGIVTDWFLFCPTAMRISPPLVISPEDLKNAIHQIVEILGRISY